MKQTKKENNNNRLGEDPLSILVVDDDKTNLTLVNKILKINGFNIDTAMTGKEALDKVHQHIYDVILLDVMMPGMSGYEVCKKIKDDDATRLIPVIILTALNSREDRIKGIEAGCDDFISKPLDKTELVTRIKALGKVKRLNDDLDQAEAVVMSLARAVEAKDETTCGHCDRLIDLAARFGRFLHIPKNDIKTLERVSVLHDVGKIGMPDSILLKPSKLTPQEWKIMKEHPLIGEEICKPLRTLKKVYPIIKTHHEKWNGSGYPEGLKGKKIPYLARVFQIIDAFDALTTERPYKKAFTKNEALKILKKESQEGLWDSDIISKFIEFISLET